MKFAKVYDNKRYNQIVMMKQQDESGALEIRFFFNPEGFGVCSFAIGFNAEDPDCEKKVETAFEKITPREIIEVIDGFMKQMEQKQDDGKALH